MITKTGNHGNKQLTDLFRPLEVLLPAATGAGSYLRAGLASHIRASC